MNRIKINNKTRLVRQPLVQKPLREKGLAPYGFTQYISKLCEKFLLKKLRPVPVRIKVKTRSGFTLIEMVIAMSVAFLLTAAAVSFTRPYPKIKVHSAANNMASDIRYAQELAITRRQTYGVYFSPTSETYYLYRQSTGNKVTSPVTGQEMIMVYPQHSEYVGVNLYSTNFGYQLEFNTAGAPVDTSGALLSSESQINLSHSSGYTITVRVEPETGKVKIQ